MKNIVILFVLMLLFSSAINAQNRSVKKVSFTPEQQATLKSKKMALSFDLNKNQQKSIYKLILKNAKERKVIRNQSRLRRQSGKTKSQVKHFEFENNRLDRQLAYKKELKNILTEKQFEKWDKTAKRKNGKRGMKSTRMNKKLKRAFHKSNSSQKQQNRFKI